MLPAPQMPLALFGRIGVGELLLIALFALLLFGKRLPEIGRNIGRSVVEFKKGLKSGSESEEAGDGAKAIASAKSKRVNTGADEP